MFENTGLWTQPKGESVAPQLQKDFQPANHIHSLHLSKKVYHMIYKYNEKAGKFYGIFNQHQMCTGRLHTWKRRTATDSDHSVHNF